MTRRRDRVASSRCWRLCVSGAARRSRRQKKDADEDASGSGLDRRVAEKLLEANELLDQDEVRRGARASWTQAREAPAARGRRAGADPPLPRLHLRQQGDERAGGRGVREVARPERARSQRRAGDDLLAGAALHAARQVRRGARADRHLVRERGEPEAGRLLPEGHDPGAAGEVRRRRSSPRRPRSRHEPEAARELAPAAGRDLRPSAGLPERGDDAGAARRHLARQEALLGAARRGAEPPGARREGARDAAARPRGRAAERGQGVPPARASALPARAALPVRAGDRGGHRRRAC